MTSLFRSVCKVALLSFPALVLAGCEEEATPLPAPEFTVEIVAPTEGDFLFVQRDVTFAARVLPISDDFDADEIALEYDWRFGDGAASNGTNASLTHTYTLSGPMDVTVTVSNPDSGYEASATVRRELLPAADLVAGEAALTVATAITTADDTIRVSGNVRNSAAEVPLPFKVGTYIGALDQIDPAAPMTPDELAAHIAAGTVRVLEEKSFDRFNEQPAEELIDNNALQVSATVPSGDYWVFLYADPEDVVGETNEANNISFASRRLVFQSVTAGVDLLVRDVVARPVRSNELTSVTFSAVIQNPGLEPATLTDYKVYLSAGAPSFDEGDVEIYAAELPNVPAEGEIRLERIVVPLSEPVTTLGDYFAIVVVDTGNTVTEVQEDNNLSASNRMVVTDQPVPGADIVPTSFSVAPDVTYLDGSVEWNLTVANQGTSDIPIQFFCSLYFSTDRILDRAIGADTLMATSQFSPLGAGTNATTRTDVIVPEFVLPGDYYTIVACDPSFIVEEADDDNNELASEDTLFVAASAVVDLEVRNIEVEGTSAEFGAPVSFAFDVCNNGTNGSTPSIVQAVLSMDTLADSFDPILYEARITPINAGECVTINATAPATCNTFESEYNVLVLADASDLMEETDETNNVGRYDREFNVTGPQCECVLDAFEPNGSPAAAKFLNERIPLYEDLSMCTDNSDHYLIPLLAGQTVSVAIEFDNDFGDLDMTLFAPDLATTLDSSTTTGDREEVSYIRVPSRGNYLLRVKGKTGQDRNLYDLTLNVSSPAPGFDLTVLDVATSLTNPVLGESLDVTFDIVNVGDTAVPASLVRVYLSADTEIDPVTDIFLGELAIEGFADRLERSLNVTLPNNIPGGEYYVAVLADARNDLPGELSETNNLSIAPVIRLNDDCFDVLEPNNSLDTPHTVELAVEPPVTLSDLLVCTENRDVYELCAADGDFLTVRIDFASSIGDIDVKMYDDTGAQVDQSESIGDSETVAIDYVNGDQCYRVEIYVAGRDRQVPYSMTVDQGTASSELACSRIEEPNNDFGSALELREYLDNCMAVCPSDDSDYYYINLSAGAEISLNLTSEDGSAVPTDLRLALFGPSRNFLGNTVNSTETLRENIALTGRHYVRVESVGAGPRNQNYCLTIDGVSGTDLVVSNFELDTDVAAGGDDVRFTFDIANARDTQSAQAYYGVYLSADPVLDEDDTLLREVTLAPVPGFANRVEGRHASIPESVTEGGAFYLILRIDSRDQVREFAENNNVIFQPILITPRCVADIAEPNNFPVDAFDISAAEGEELTSCSSSDQDWYTFVATRTLQTISISFLDAVGDLNLLVFNEDLELVTISDGVTDLESITLEADPGARYYVLVEQYTDGSPNYTLSFE